MYNKYLVLSLHPLRPLHRREHSLIPGKDEVLQDAECSVKCFLSHGQEVTSDVDDLS